jgi:ABC-2 type transport system ATP-binding protein
MLKVKKISKNFGTTKAVKELSFELNKGDIAGLLGPNGAGKTTTMRMITSYYYPSEGTITINDIDTQKDTIESQSLIGYLPENNPLYLDMLVVDFLMMSAKLQNIAKAEITDRIKKIADKVGIQDRLLSPINELSKGYKQRVGLAAAMIHNPPLLILDEPTEGLDPNQRNDIRDLIKEISKEKVILISTHVMQEVKAMCNKVIVINNGKLVAEGSPDSLAGTKVLKVKIEGKNVVSALKKLLTEKGEKLKITDKNEKVRTFHLHSNRELRPEVSKLAAKNDWVIWETEIEDSLEGVFKNLKNTND